MALVGVQELARALGVAKGTVSKRAAAGTIPVADRDRNGFPLFDVEAVRIAWSNNSNPLMKRRGVNVDVGVGGFEDGAGEPEEDDEGDNDDRGERHSPRLPREPREPSGLLEQQVVERKLRNRRLVRQLGEDEGLFVLKAVVENEVTTLGRQTRDGVTAQVADYASKLYAFISTARSEGELRIWLTEHAGLAFDEVEKALAAEQGDEFVNGEATDVPGTADAVAAP